MTAGASDPSARLADAYNRVLYPPSVFDHTHPERLAMIAQLHGLVTPPLETARVLELGGGDGLNLLAMAAGLPRAAFLSVDIAAAPVRTGAALAQVAGLGNVRIEQADVLDLAEGLDGQFDYVIAHGLYAWVPETVRAAVMRLIGRVLAPDGIAFVSYNAEPGGRIRGLLRDMALTALEDDLPPEERTAAARRVLAEFGTARPDDSPLMRGMRDQARTLAERAEEVLAHDELGPFYAPQPFAAVAAAAAAHGLAYLNDAERRQLEDGFPEPPPASDAAFLRAIQLRDYQDLRFFRHSLFVRAGRAIDRRFDAGRLDRLWLSSRARRTGRHTFDYQGTEFELGDDALCDLLEHAAALHPHRVALGPLALDPERRDVLVRLFDNRICRLHSAPVPGVTDSARPCASPLARAQIAAGATRIAQLDQHLTGLDADVRGFLLLLDGSRDLAALAEPWSRLRAAREVALEDAIRMLGRQALLVA